VTRVRDYEEEAYIRERICKAETRIAAIEDAHTALASGATSYTLDDGQTRQSVTKAQMGELRIALNEAILSRDMWKSRLNGVDNIHRPGW